MVGSSHIRRMDTKPESEVDDGSPVPDNDSPDIETLTTVRFDSFGLEATAEQLEQVTKNMETLLLDVEQLRSSCSDQAGELLQVAADLRKQQQELRESYAELSRELQDMMGSVEELLGTKSAFEAKEKETEKLNRLL